MQITLDTTTLTQDNIAKELIKTLNNQINPVTDNRFIAFEKDNIALLKEELNNDANDGKLEELEDELNVSITKVRELEDKLKAKDKEIIELEKVIDIKNKFIQDMNEDLKKDMKPTIKEDNNNLSITEKLKKAIKEDDKLISIEDKLLSFDEIIKIVDTGNEISPLKNNWNNFTKSFKDNNNKKATKKAVSLYILDNLEKHYPQSAEVIIKDRGYVIKSSTSGIKIHEIVEDVYNTICKVINNAINNNKKDNKNSKIINELLKLNKGEINFEDLTIDYKDIREFQKNNYNQYSEEIDNFNKLNIQNRFIKHSKIAKELELAKELENDELIKKIYINKVNDCVRAKVIDFMKDRNLDEVVNIKTINDFNNFETLLINCNPIEDDDIDTDIEDDDIDTDIEDDDIDTDIEDDDIDTDIEDDDIEDDDIDTDIEDDDIEDDDIEDDDIEDDNNYNIEKNKVSKLYQSIKANVSKDTNFNRTKAKFELLNDEQKDIMLSQFGIISIDDPQFDNWDYNRFIDIIDEVFLIDEDDFIIDEDF